jgi:hypothetical protein
LLKVGRGGRKERKGRRREREGGGERRVGASEDWNFQLGFLILEWTSLSQVLASFSKLRESQKCLCSGGNKTFYPLACVSEMENVAAVAMLSAPRRCRSGVVTVLLLPWSIAGRACG